MKWQILCKSDYKYYDTYDAAVEAAKRHTQRYQQEVYVLQAIAETKLPVPEIEVLKLEAPVAA